MRKYFKRVKDHKHLSFATITKEGIGAVHLKNPIPLYRLRDVVHKLGFMLTTARKAKHHHLKVRNRKNDLVATILNLDLVLLPKYAKTKRDAIDLVNALLEHRP